jgi:hypothetical protein
MNSSAHYYLDVPADDLDNAADIISTHTGEDVIPYASYPHPSDKEFHRMEFETKREQRLASGALGRFGIENHKLN